MLRKIFRSQRSGYAAFLLMIASLLSYATGLFRDKVLAFFFGASKYTDAYNAAFLIPDFLFNAFIAGAIATAFVPVFSNYLKINKKEADQIASTILTFGTLLFAVLIVIFYFAVPHIVPLIPLLIKDIKDFDAVLVTDLTRIMLFSPLLFTISNGLGSILITHKNYLGYALSSFFYNFGIIIGIYMLHEQIGIYAACYGAVFGAFLHLAIRFMNILTIDYKFKPTLSLRHPGIKRIFKLMIPRSVSLVAWQVTLWVYTFVGYSLAEGNVAAFNFARNMQSFPVSLFGIAFATAIFPFLSDHANNKDYHRFSDDFQISLEKILFFAVPAAVGMLLLHQDLITLILKGGAFDDRAVLVTSSVLFFFILSIPIESCVHLFARGFYAFKNTLMPMIFAVLAAAINITACLYLSSQIGVIGISIAFMIGTSIQLLLLALFFSKRLVDFRTSAFTKKLGIIVGASTFMGAVVYAVPSVLSLGFLTQLFLQVIVGAAVYFVITYVFKCKELQFFSVLLQKMTKRKNA